MKKFLLSALVISATAFQAQAQLKLGVKGGLNLANLHHTHSGSTPDTDGFKNKIGYHAGVIAQLPVLGNFSIQAEALYNLKGAKLENQNSDNKGPALSYFSVPVLVVFKPAQKFGIQGGVEFSSLLSANQKSGGKDRNIKDDFEGNDVGLVGGIQIQLTENFNFDARYVYGLTTIREDNFANRGSIATKNRAFQFSLAYFFLK